MISATAVVGEGRKGLFTGLRDPKGKRRCGILGPKTPQHEMMTITLSELILRLAVSVLLCGAIGYER
jgi:hypothetical protein